MVLLLLIEFISFRHQNMSTMHTTKSTHWMNRRHSIILHHITFLQDITRIWNGFRYVYLPTWSQRNSGNPQTSPRLEGQGLPRPLAAGVPGLGIHGLDVVLDISVVSVVLQSCTAAESGWIWWVLPWKNHKKPMENRWKSMIHVGFTVGKMWEHVL